jgi:hypothetical protein
VNPALLVGIILLAGLLYFLFVSRIVSAFTRRVLRADYQRKTLGRQVLLEAWGANFFGQVSTGGGQIRGNGVLALTSKELIFILAYPRRVTEIPLNTITSVSLARSHLGRTIVSPLLKVEFQGKEGNDAVAWAVPDPHRWIKAIQTAQGGISWS